MIKKKSNGNQYPLLNYYENLRPNFSKNNQNYYPEQNFNNNTYIFYIKTKISTKVYVKRIKIYVFI